MQRLIHPCGNALASAMLVMVAFGTAPGAAFSQDAIGAAVRDWERRTAQAARARVEQRARMEQSRSHAQMPDTMYASTPDPSTPPHPFPLDVGLKSAPERSGSPPGMAARSAMLQTHRIGLFPSDGDALGRQGFARVINHSASDGEVDIDAWDDDGKHYGPLTLDIGAGETVHFNSEDLETGNAGKGLEGSTGPPEKGDWRLELSSTLDLQVLSYIRTSDGFLTSMHDFVGRTEAGQHRVAIFNPGKNANQASRLRLINPGAEPTEVRIEGVDDKGESPGAAVVLTLEGGVSRTLSAKDLEAGTGVSGGLGTGKGKWRLVVSADVPIEVLNTLSTPTGHLTNLSTAPGDAESDDATHRIGLFPSDGDALGRQGFARVINHSASDGEVDIDAWDDDGKHYGPLTLDIDAGETVHFNSEDLEEGNTGKGLEGSTGPPEKGDWRLELSSTLELQVLSYIRTSDGFLTSMHDFVGRTEAGQHRVAIFNPGKNTNQASRLRLINPGAERTEVRIEGVDDKGQSPGEAVVFTLEAGVSRTLSAKDLESGTGVSGGLGTGQGKWQLVVSADEPIEVLNTLSTPTGHLTNLSTVSGAAVSAETAADVFREHISGPIVQGKCIACHVGGGLAGATRLLFAPASRAGHEGLNLGVFEDFIAKVEDAEVEDGAAYILNKIQGVAHGGGVQVAAGTPEFADMERFLGLLGAGVESAPLTPQTLFDTVKPASPRKTLRRAALIFAGRIPTDAEYAAAERGADALRAAIRGLMEGPAFHEFLIRGANDRLLTERDFIIIDANDGYVEYIDEIYRRKREAYDRGWTERTLRRLYNEWNETVQYGFRRAPLALIAHVVENDLPYTEVMTADYIMANPWAAKAYGAPTHHFDDPEDIHEFKPSQIVKYYRRGPGYVRIYDREVDTARILDPGSLITNYPHAGILNTTSFLYRYPTTATNRNRARSRWTYYHFLGVDIEKSASRTTDPVALADTNNPTLRNPACTVCHRIMDPVAGTFQNYSDSGYYRYSWGGADSLDDLYKTSGGEARAIRAESWEERETLSWPVWLPAGVQTLRVLYANDYYDPDTGDDGVIFLDRLRVADAQGGVLASHEFEDLELPIPYRGGDEFSCGDKERNPAGELDHIRLWNGGIPCAYFLDVEVPSDGTYRVAIVAWMNGRHTLFGEDGLARLSVAPNAYQEGDTWFRDVRAPGFNGKLAPNSNNSVQWLAKQIVADERFATATVEFWWPAIMGSEVAEPPEDEEDADFEGLLLAANAQGAEVARLADGFRRGSRGGSAYNLKDLLVEIVMSQWFRADEVEDSNPVRAVALRDAGARRPLTPEELDYKTAAVTGFKWGRQARITEAHRGERSQLTDEYRLLYGGIDSDGVTERARDITSVMAGVVERHATQVSCPVVMRDFFLVSESERRLFAGIDRRVTSSDAIRSKLVELHDELLGVQVTPQSPDVESAYQVFVNAMERRRQANDRWFDWYECDTHFDHTFFEGILDDAVVEREDPESGWRHYDLDWDRIDSFMDGVDFSDPHQTAQAWVVVLAYLLMDYRYLYL